MGYTYNTAHKTMSYQREQFDKNEQLIQKEMVGQDKNDIADVQRSIHQTWANESEAIEIIKAKKEEVSKRANPDEIEEAFKNLRI